MTKKNYIFLAFLIIIFLIINFFVFYKFYFVYSAEKKYQNNNFSGAINDYKKSLENNYFLTQNFEKNIFYNLGNSYYRFWQKTDEKILNYEKSLENYEKSIDIKKEENAQDNYDFVLEQLNKLKEEKSLEEEEQEKSNEEQNSQQHQEGSDKENNQNDSESKEKNEQTNSQKNSNFVEKSNNEKNNTQSSQDKINPDFEKQEIYLLTDDEKKYLENYGKYIEDSQRDYNNYFDKQNQDSTRDLFDMFFEKKFLENNNSWSQKDW